MKKSAFTLIELLITVSIMATLTGMVAMNVFGSLAKARDAKRKSDLREIKTSLNLYYSIKNMYPSSLHSVFGPWKFDGSEVISGCGTAMVISDCPWGDPWIQDGVTYMGKLPVDPQGTQGYFYQRAPSGRLSYILMAKLERSIDPDIQKSWSDCSSTDPDTGLPTLSYQSPWFVVCDSK